MDELSRGRKGSNLTLFRAGDIYLVTLEPTFGREQRGSRPVLVITTEEFNRLATLPVVLPITSGGAYARNRGFAVPLPPHRTQTTGYILCHQPRSLDLAAREAHYLERASQDTLDEALHLLLSLLAAGL